MIQPLFALSDTAFFLLRIALAFFFLRDAYVVFLQKEKQKNSLEKILLGVEFVGGIVLLFGFFTQIAVGILILFFLVQKSRSAPCIFLETELLALLVFLSLLVLLAVGGGYWSIDNILQIIIY